MSYSLTGFQNSEVPDKQQLAETVKTAPEIQFECFIYVLKLCP